MTLAPLILHGDLQHCYKIKLRKQGWRLIYRVKDEVLIVMAVAKREDGVAYRGQTKWVVLLFFRIQLPLRLVASQPNKRRDSLAKRALARKSPWVMPLPYRSRKLPLSGSARCSRRWLS